VTDGWPSVIRLRATGFDLPALTLSTRPSDAVIEGMKTVSRLSVFGYFEDFGQNMQYLNDAYRNLPRPLK
jgi:hypothetical protein